MVARPPIEKWNRAELEDNYHNVLQLMKEYQKKNADMEKKLTQLNSKFRRAVMERKNGQQTVEKEKFDQLLNENHLLSMKLKSVKHQLLTYTAPTARTATALAMTGRSTFRPPSTVRRHFPLNSASDKTARNEGSGAESHRPQVVRIVENSLEEKAAVIRLNRQVREKNAQLNNLQFDLDTVKTQLGETKALLQQKTKEAADLANKIKASTTAGSEFSIEAEVLRKELSLAKEELSLLSSANERLVKQSLAHEAQPTRGGRGGEEILELRSTVEEMEDRLRQTEKKLKESQKQLNSWKNKANKMEALLKNRPQPPPVTEQHEKPYSRRREEDDEQDSLDEDYSPPRAPKKKNRKVDDVLTKLYEDVTGILGSHGAVDVDDVITRDMTTTQKLAKWQKMYSELYEELEKVRNMLLLQHNINQKQTSEISLLKEECDRLVLDRQARIKEITLKVEEKQKKIDVLEQQIHSIAYSGQKPLKSMEKPTEADLSTRLSIKLTKLRMINASGANSVFMSLEFFDFELQTTPVLKAIDQSMDFATIYDVVASNLFMHYLQSNGITIELYRAKSSSYEIMAAGTVSLNDLIGKKNPAIVGGELCLRNLANGQVIAIVTYELTISKELDEALSSYKRAEAAQKLLPIEVPNLDPGWNELCVSIQRCSGLDKISSEPMEVCVVYEFLAFSPYVTENYIGEKSVEINNDKKWPLPQEALQFFHDQEISFYLMDRSVHRTEEGVLTMLSLPLAPLLANSQIRGSFPMIKADGTEPGVFLDVCIKWKFDLELPKIIPPRSPIPESESSEESVRAPSTPSVIEVPHEEIPHTVISEEEVESVSSTSRSEESFETVEKVEPMSPPKHRIETPIIERSPTSSEGSNDTFTKEIHEAEIEDEEDRDTPVPDYLADLPPVAKPRFMRTSMSLESERRSSEDDSARRLVGFRSPLHHSIPPSETSSVSSPRREKPPVPLPREGGKSVIKVLGKPEDEFSAEEEPGDQTVTITIHQMKNTAYSPLMERRFEGLKFFIDWKFLDFPDADCRVPTSVPIPVIWNQPMVFEYTKEYRLSHRRVALLEQYVETQNHLEFCLVSDCGDDSEELAVAALEMVRIPPDEPISIPMLDVNGVRWVDLEVTLTYSKDIFDSIH